MNLFGGLAIAGVILAGFAIPLALGKVSRNDFYGIRTPRTMKGSISDWYALNKRAGMALSLLGGILFAVGALGAAIRLHSYVSLTLTVVLSLFGIIGVMLKYWE